MNILIVEDEADLSNSIHQYLQQSGFYCDIAFTYEAARNKITTSKYDCVILDISLPDGNGLQLLRTLKAGNKPDGVLIISAKNSLDDKLSGLELGADDYLTKPFHLAELTARVNAIIRRKSFDGQNLISIDKLKINILLKTVQTEAGTLPLTRKEYELLLYFVSNKNRVVTKESLSEHLWGDQSTMSETYDFIYSHIKNLRKKLLEAGCSDFIKSVYGLGYKLSLS